MMIQPELGKKIAELRKAKGFTQEELVEKCNLNVRTLQRIESGEVSPRSYTLKIIFTALEYNMNDSSKGFSHWFGNAGLMISRWLGQFYNYVIDLFNLKTNTMKKLMILSIPFFISCITLMFSISQNTKAQSRRAIREKFEKVSSNLDYIHWFNTGQIDSVGSRYLDNACVMPDQNPIIMNRKSLNDYNRNLYLQGLRFIKLISTSRVITDSIAIDRGTWSIGFNSAAVATGTYLTQWHYIHGQWWIENEMSKSDKSGPAEASK